MIKKEEEIRGQKLTQKQAAELIGLSESQARELRRKESPAPRNKDGTYDPVEVVSWYVAKLNAGIDDKIKQEKLRKLKRENDVAENRLIDVEALRPHTQTLEASLRELGDSLARKSKLTGRQAQAMLNTTLRTVVRKIESVNSPDK